MTQEQLNQLGDALKEIPALVKRFGKDGQQVQAFADDVTEALKLAKKDEEKVALLSSLTLAILLALKGVRDFKFYKPSSYDMLKEMRLKCDDIARAGDFKRYKALRNL